jgi:hypothetical protein
MALTGLKRAELEGVIEALGFDRDDNGRFVRRKMRRRPRVAPPSAREAALSPFAALRHLRGQGS